MQWRSLLSKFFHPPVTSSVLVQNTFLITPFSITFSLWSSVNTKGQVSHPYATWGVIIVLSSKGHPNNMFIIVIWWLKTKIDVHKSTSSNCNSPFNVFSVFNTQTVRHIPKTHTIYSVHLRQTHYVFHESITWHPTTLYIYHLSKLFVYC